MPLWPCARRPRRGLEGGGLLGLLPEFPAVPNRACHDDCLPIRDGSPRQGDRQVRKVAIQLATNLFGLDEENKETDLAEALARPIAGAIPETPEPPRPRRPHRLQEARGGGRGAAPRGSSVRVQSFTPVMRELVWWGGGLFDQAHRLPPALQPSDRIA